MRCVIGVIIAVATALPAAAQDLLGRREALRLIYPADAEVESVVLPHPSLSAPEVELLGGAIEQGLMPQMVFYGALAIDPERGLADPQTTVAVGNYHDEISAATAALAGCEAGRDDPETEACTIVLVVRPAGWEAGGVLQLSAGAAEALRTEFRRLGRPRVFAISDATGTFGMGPSQETALAGCGAPDCRTVIADN